MYQKLFEAIAWAAVIVGLISGILKEWNRRR